MGWIGTTGQWLAALGLGALIVRVCFWSHFDEPSYDGTEHFTRKTDAEFASALRQTFAGRCWAHSTSCNVEWRGVGYKAE